MLEQVTLDFLRDLTRNNNRDWFQANRTRYEKELKKPFADLINSLIERLAQEDPTLLIPAKDAIFRINRDTRFSKDKTPYKDHAGALISPYGRQHKEYPGFYFHLEGGRLMLGGGAYFLENNTLQLVRDHIARQPQRFLEIIHHPDFVAAFETIQGEQHKRLAAEYREIQERVPEIANKQWYYMAEFPAETVLRPDFIEWCTQLWLKGKPLNDFVSEVMVGK